MTGRIADITTQVDGLVTESKRTETRLHNVFNDFLMLSSVQFVENRVYDFEEKKEGDPAAAADDGAKSADSSENKPSEKEVEEEKTREQREAELIPRITAALKLGIQVMENSFEKIEVTPEPASVREGDDEDEDEEREAPEDMEPILEPKDPYLLRPLPHVIGSVQFLQSDDVGLLLAESDDEEEEEEDEEDSEGDEDDDEKATEGADDLVGGGLKGSSDDSYGESDDSDDSNAWRSASPDGSTHDTRSQRQGSVAAADASSVSAASKKKPAGGLFDDDDEDDDDFDDEDAAADIFDEKPKRKETTPADDDNNAAPAAPARRKPAGGLFDDDDEDDDEDDAAAIFDEKPKRKESAPADDGEDAALAAPAKKKPAGAVSMFGGADLFGMQSSKDDSTKSEVSTPGATTKRGGGGLFDDGDNEGDDMFADPVPKPKAAAAVVPAAAPPVKKAAGLFDDDDDDIGFGSPPAPAPATEKPSTSVSKSAAPASGLFDDADDDDMFAAPKPKQTTQPAQPDDSSPVEAPKKKKPAGAVSMFGGVAPPVKKASGLFDDDDDDDIGFSNLPTPAAKTAPSAVTKEAAKVPAAVSKPAGAPGLFDGDDDDDDMFAVPKPKAAQPAVTATKTAPSAVPKEPAKLPSAASKPAGPPGLFDGGDDDDDDMFGVPKPKSAQPAVADESPVPAKKKPAGAVSMFGGADLFGATKKSPASNPTTPSDDDDLFGGVTSKKPDAVLPTPVAKTSPSAGRKEPAKAPAAVSKPAGPPGLFDGGQDDDDDDMFAVPKPKAVQSAVAATKTAPSAVGKEPAKLPSAASKPVGPPGLFDGGDDDDDDDMFGVPKPKAAQPAVADESPVPAKKKPAGAVSMFGGADLFGPPKKSPASNPTTPSKDDDLFGGVTSMKPESLQPRAARSDPVASSAASFDEPAAAATLVSHTKTRARGPSRRRPGHYFT